MPAHLRCWFTVLKCGGARRRDLNALASPDAIQRTASVMRVAQILSQEPREDDIQSMGVPSTRRFRVFCDVFFRGVVSGRHDLVASLRSVATAFRIASGMIDAVQVAVAVSDAFKLRGCHGGHRVTNDRCQAWACRVCDLQVVVLVGLHYSWLVVVERQLGLPCVTVVTAVVCPGGGTVLWFSVVPRGSSLGSGLPVRLVVEVFQLKGGLATDLDMDPYWVWISKAVTVGIRAMIKLEYEKTLKAWACRVCDLQVVVLVGLHCSWLVVVERQLDLPSVTVRLEGSSCALLSSLGIGLPVKLVVEVFQLKGGLAVLS
ncbi:hypothetical protein Taro_007985 [Colocasia esculenta]|uniref:Uncharacterized protein n=1 Tax=Colocasia esculenta TaxID=4460 RepID=A0A843TZS2_COLES|nr:hypothetical protein [Colocasia esculenta]